MGTRQAVTDAARTLLLAIVFFGALAFVAWRAGLFARLGPEVVTALFAFAAAFAALTLACDRELREYLRGVVRARRALRKAAAKSPAARPAAS